MTEQHTTEERELEMQLEQARRVAELNALMEPRAVSAEYDAAEHRIVVRLRSGAVFSFPVRIAQGIAEGTAAELAEVEVTPAGDGLHWEGLDADLSVAGLLAGRFGSGAWMAGLRASL
ncbi:MAG: DUF2442 domain-containing protein [Geitlerinemataceae cyanobacterium]